MYSLFIDSCISAQTQNETTAESFHLITENEWRSLSVPWKTTHDLFGTQPGLWCCAAVLWRAGQLDQWQPSTKLKCVSSVAVGTKAWRMVYEFIWWGAGSHHQHLHPSSSKPSLPTPPWTSSRVSATSLCTAVTRRAQSSHTEVICLEKRKKKKGKKGHCIVGALCCAAVLLHCLVYWFNG